LIEHEAAEGLMARIVITGSAEGLGRAAAQNLLDDGHEVVYPGRVVRD
jgi:NAD(P)-dependent dehydrogenase (short-subunit alcohol dehydrogenase family)